MRSWAFNVMRFNDRFIFHNHLCWWTQFPTIWGHWFMVVYQLHWKGHLVSLLEPRHQVACWGLQGQCMKHFFLLNIGHLWYSTNDCVLPNDYITWEWGNTTKDGDCAKRTFRNNYISPTYYSRQPNKCVQGSHRILACAGYGQILRTSCMSHH